MFWQMALFNKFLKDCRGGIGTAVLTGILCAAVCLHAAAYWVRQEAEENSRRILRRQLQFAVQALAKAGFENGSLPEGELICRRRSCTLAITRLKQEYLKKALPAA